MVDVKTDWNRIRLTCDCGQRIEFGTSLSGTSYTCRKCAVEFLVPHSPDYEQFKRNDWAIKPKDTIRKTPLAALCHYGKEADRVEFYLSDDVSYLRLIWPDVAIWIKSEDMDRMVTGSKGRRKPYTVSPPITDMPGGQLIAVGSIN